MAFWTTSTVGMYIPPLQSPLYAYELLCESNLYLLTKIEISILGKDKSGKLKHRLKPLSLILFMQPTKICILLRLCHYCPILIGTTPYLTYCSPWCSIDRSFILVILKPNLLRIDDTNCKTTFIFHNN